MKKGYLTVNDLTIAYYTKNPKQENTIFFIHGNSSSSNAWRKQVESTSLNDYRLIAIDLPSHGNSTELDANKETI